ncbi:hypothetical protein E0L36_23950 [Streptomyces sp. AJS327]|uniref:hypothetical protein n=1 Tax=Streptomyces sp. AJS327 TaxID=2545265 RepID=UPI0015DF06A7|nr:hypothetical protein [Streptomyces sp. AJS327]MBA0053798.1 hypothetical protein [Streptomyces sp. AJS327]
MSIGGDEYGEHGRLGETGPGRGPGERGLTTRTHLPGDEGGGRPPARPGRNLITVIGVVVLLIAAIAFANKGDGGDTEAGGDDKGDAQPTAPSGEKPVEDSANGIASGFPRTEQGAQSAAANFAVALVSDKIVQPEERQRIVSQVFVPSRVDEMRTKMDKAYSTTFLDGMGLDEDGKAAAKGATYVSRTAPVGTTVVTYENRSAKVDVWCTGVFGMAGEDTTNPVTSDWFTMKLDLRWADGEWKVHGFTQKQGPAPVNGDNRASTADQIAEAVRKFGGFTYAR